MARWTAAEASSSPNPEQRKAILAKVYALLIGLAMEKEAADGAEVSEATDPPATGHALPQGQDAKGV